jgi:3-phosphoshikimate 1-carboxyvinyltransferase
VPDSVVLETIAPFSYRGELQVPFSKSYLQRAMAIGVLHPKRTVIHGFTPGNDALAAKHIIETLGARTSLRGQTLEIVPSSDVPNAVNIHCGESGLSTRMFSPIAASLSESVTVSGEGSILQRPMSMVIDALTQLGADVYGDDNRLPLRIQGGIKPGILHIDGSESSQLLTGLLIALAFKESESVIHVHDLKSIPYIQMTLDILEHFGIKIRHENYEVFYTSGYEYVRAEPYHVEGDWSGAAFHVVGAALSGEVRLLGLNPNSAQADRAIVEAIEKAGASARWENGVLHIVQGDLQAIEFDATHCPDLFPPLAALAAGSKGTSVFKGVSRLASKESNRGLTIQAELRKLGVDVELDGDRMRVHGGVIRSNTIHSNNDHRIAMMAAVLATRSNAAIHIEQPDAVNKSYPNFYQDIQQVAKELA